jgi:hypothetical protein
VFLITGMAERILYIIPVNFVRCPSAARIEVCMSTTKVVLVDTLRVFGVLAAILTVPAILMTFAPGVPRTIASLLAGLF